LSTHQLPLEIISFDTLHEKFFDSPSKLVKQTKQSNNLCCYTYSCDYELQSL